MAVAESLSTSTLAALDRDMFQPSAMPSARQQDIQSKFRSLKMPAGSTSTYRLEFRKSDEIGANAMALPSGIIVVTDGLVALAEDDREILGVLAHEAGHVEHKHGLRGILQNSLIGMVVAWVVGDVSSIAAAAPAALLEASYSRDLEREADAFAIDVLALNDVQLRYLAAMLRRLESASSASGMSSALRYLSTHPATDERIAQLEGR
jgi:Zn-dependent protease with chaperone function